MKSKRQEQPPLSKPRSQTLFGNEIAIQTPFGIKGNAKLLIPFNTPYFTGKELEYIRCAVESRSVKGNGEFTRKCQEFFKERYGFRDVLLTTSCTHALEMCAILLDIKEGDEVIIPSYTFVSSANAFALRGARIVFADSEENTPNIDVSKIEPLITPRTRAIAAMHYGGVACDMDALMRIAERNNLYVVEDAAQAVDSYYKGSSLPGGVSRHTVSGRGGFPLGSIGHLAAFSFHETKNINSGEGGMLVISDERFIKRAEIIREMGTNRAAFFRGEVDKYGWVDIGSSYLPSEVTAAFLYAQLEELDRIQKSRKMLWQRYYESLKPLEDDGILRLPHIPPYATNNGHHFYVLCKNLEERVKVIKFLRENGIEAAFHYLPLHRSEYYRTRGHAALLPRKLPNAERYSDCLLRLPMYYELTENDVELVCSRIKEFYRRK